jgi:hypothetical protein
VHRTRYVVDGYDSRDYPGVTRVAMERTTTEPNIFGEQASDLELESTRGDTVRRSDTLESGPTVLVFFRGNWC